MKPIWDLLLAENIEKPRAQVGHAYWVMGPARSLDLTRLVR